MTPSPIQKMLYSKRDAAFVLSVCPRTIDNLIITKQLTPFRIGTRVLIRADELKRFCKTDHPELN